MRRFLAVLGVVTVLAAACGDSKDDASTVSTETVAPAAGSKAETFEVEVDAKKAEYAEALLSYFPAALSARPGDTVKFHSNDTGEPHTVTFGTIADASVKAFQALPPGALDAPDAEPPAEVKAAQEKLPSLLPDGPGDANQVAANPCFVAAGDPPTDPAAACPKPAAQPDFTGTESVYNSGYLGDDDTFSLKLADDIAPGTYRYMCLLHREGMSGTLTVVAKDQTVPTPDEVKATGAKALSEVQAKLKPAAEALEAATADKAQAGGGSPDVPEGIINEFGPGEAAIPVGGSVTWNLSGAHTIAFNAPEDARNLMVKAPDGTFHANAKAFMPAGGPGAPPPPEGPPPADAKPVAVDGGSYDGSGFRSSGILLSFGPPGLSYKLTFTKAGTYSYLCQIHPDMKGTVKVG